MSKKTMKKKLGCERLENRELMAGNVTVSVEFNEVIVRGDSRDNAIEVYQLDNGAFRINGLNGTTVNGKSFETSFSRDRDLRIRLGGGNDQLALGNNFARPQMVVEDLEVDMGAGSDIVIAGNLRTTDNQEAVFRLGRSTDAATDNDFFAAGGMSVSHGLRIETGTGRDAVGLQEVNVNGRLTVDLGAGDDSVTLINAVWASTNLIGGSGTDTYKRTGGQAAVIRGFEKVL